VLPVCAIGNLVLPAAHIIATPASAAERFHSTRILNLPAEIERSKEPPHYASAFVYDQLGMEAFGAGDHARARVNFELALRFDPDFAKARADRGIVLYLEGNRDEGLAELSAAIGKAPWLYEARMQRATFRDQAGDTAGALEDVQAALGFMPADWPRRKDAEDFAHALAAKRAAGR